MGFFSRGKDEDGEQAEALAGIEAGGIPPHAQRAAAASSAPTARCSPAACRSTSSRCLTVSGPSRWRRSWARAWSGRLAVPAGPAARDEGRQRQVPGRRRVDPRDGAPKRDRGVSGPDPQLQVAHGGRVRTRRADRGVEPGPPPGAGPARRGGAAGGSRRRRRRSFAAQRPRLRQAGDRIRGHGHRDPRSPADPELMAGADGRLGPGLLAADAAPDTSRSASWPRRPPCSRRRRGAPGSRRTRTPARNQELERTQRGVSGRPGRQSADGFADRWPTQRVGRGRGRVRRTRFIARSCRWPRRSDARTHRGWHRARWGSLPRRAAAATPSAGAG